MFKIITLIVKSQFPQINITSYAEAQENYKEFLINLYGTSNKNPYGAKRI